MKSTLFKSLVFLVCFLIVGMASGLVFAHFKAKDWVEEFLNKKIPPHVELSYGQLKTDVFTGSISFYDIALRYLNRDSLDLHTAIKLKKLSLENLDYRKFFFSERIEIEELRLVEPKATHRLTAKKQLKEEEERQGVVKLRKTIEVKKLIVENGGLSLEETDGSAGFKIDEINFEVDNIKTGPSRIKKRIPVSYEEYDLSLAGLYVNLGKYEELSVANLEFHDGQVALHKIFLRSKYDKTKLSQVIPVERDYVHLKVRALKLDAIEVGFKGDSLMVSTGKGQLIEPRAEIYRDKLVRDDVDKKRLYSQMLRELPVYIKVPDIEIVDGTLAYSEKLKEGLPPGLVRFTKLKASIKNINNLDNVPDKTEISAKALLMNHAPIELNWNFDVLHTADAFWASGIIKNFKSNTLNSFLESSLRAKAKGTIDRLYFTISGDAISSTGDIKMKYEDFEFAVLKKDRLGVNKFLTFLGNLFINDGSNSDAAGFRYGHIEATRDPTKSFFNYLWLNVQDGMVNTMLGKGKKDD